jgi:uncharacterized protein (DUF1697 family)
MPALRALLGGAGYGDVATIGQSGNAVLETTLEPEELEVECERLIAAEFGFEVAVIARTGAELAEVVKRDPLGDVVTDPRRYQVTFLAGALSEEKTAELSALASDSERLVAIGRELYIWHPDGIARSKLSSAVASASLGTKATARNWNTVTGLTEMATA